MQNSAYIHTKCVYALKYTVKNLPKHGKLTKTVAKSDIFYSIIHKGANIYTKFLEKY